MTQSARWLLHRTELTTYAETIPSWFLLNLKKWCKLLETYHKEVEGFRGILMNILKKNNGSTDFHLTSIILGDYL